MITGLSIQAYGKVYKHNQNLEATNVKYSEHEYITIKHSIAIL